VLYNFSSGEWGILSIIKVTGMNMEILRGTGRTLKRLLEMLIRCISD
jgi:hypothetical protein